MDIFDDIKELRKAGWELDEIYVIQAIPELGDDRAISLYEYEDLYDCSYEDGGADVDDLPTAEEWLAENS